MTQALPVATIFNRGRPLATIEEAQYRLIEVVIRRAPDSTLTIYCLGHDWPQTEAGKLAAKDDIILYLREREQQLLEQIEALKAQLAAQPAPPPATSPQEEEQLKTHVCLECGEEKDLAAFRLNTRGDGTKEPSDYCAICARIRGKRVRRGLPASPRDDPPPAAFVCSECKGSAFTSSIHNPEICVLCAGNRLNGHIQPT